MKNEFNYNERYNIKIDNLPDTIYTLANKLRGATQDEVKAMRLEHDVHDLFVVLIGVYGKLNANHMYFKDI